MEFDIIQQFMDENYKWTEQTFPGQPASSTAAHLVSEAKELCEEIGRTSNASTAYLNTVEDEFADVFLLLLNTAKKQGLSFRQVFVASLKKMEKNRKRKWEKNEQGYYSHIK